MKLKQTGPLILLAFIWACYYIASQQTVKEMSVFTAGIIIRFVTMILLGIVMGTGGELKKLCKVQGILSRLLLIGVMGFLLDLTAFIGLTLSPAGSGTALLKCDIIFVNLISVIIYKRQFSKKDWLYTLTMLFGVFLIMGVDFNHFSLGNSGDIFFILSAFFVSVNAFLIKSVQLDKKNPAADHVIAFYNNFVTMILFCVTSLAMGTMGQIEEMAKNRHIFLMAVLAGIGQTCIYLVYYWDLRRFPVWIVKVFLLLMPVFTTGISFLTDHTMLEKGQYAGIVIVLAGAFGILTEQRKKAGFQKDVMEGR